MYRVQCANSASKELFSRLGARPKSAFAPTSCGGAHSVDDRPAGLVGEGRRPAAHAHKLV